MTARIRRLLENRRAVVLAGQSDGRARVPEAPAEPLRYELRDVAALGRLRAIVVYWVELESAERWRRRKRLRTQKECWWQV